MLNVDRGIRDGLEGWQHVAKAREAILKAGKPLHVTDLLVALARCQPREPLLDHQLIGLRM